MVKFLLQGHAVHPHLYWYIYHKSLIMKIVVKVINHQSIYGLIESALIYTQIASSVTVFELWFDKWAPILLSSTENAHTRSHSSLIMFH